MQQGRPKVESEQGVHTHHTVDVRNPFHTTKWINTLQGSVQLNSYRREHVGPLAVLGLGFRERRVSRCFLFWGTLFLKDTL